MRRTDRQTSRLTERLDRDTKSRVMIYVRRHTKCVGYKGIRYKGLFTIASTTKLLYSKDYGL